MDFNFTCKNFFLKRARTPMTAGEINFLAKMIFKNKDSKNKWSPKDDLLLQKIIL